MAHPLLMSGGHTDAQSASGRDVRAGGLLRGPGSFSALNVLRLRRDGGFYFCGDAYVDGIMQGEYLENGPVEEEFCIY